MAEHKKGLEAGVEERKLGVLVDEAYQEEAIGARTKGSR